jgi:hypothetical protein
MKIILNRIPIFKEKNLSDWHEYTNYYIYHSIKLGDLRFFNFFENINELNFLYIWIEQSIRYIFEEECIFNKIEYNVLTHTTKTICYKIPKVYFNLHENNI